MFVCVRFLGVDKFDVSLETQKVTVESSTLSEVRILLGSCTISCKYELYSNTNQLLVLIFLQNTSSQEEILAVIQKTGKAAKVATA